MKKTKVLVIIAAAFLVLFCVLTVVLALLGTFSRDKNDPLSSARDVVLDALGVEHENEALAWQKAPDGDVAVFETSIGTIKVALFPSEGTDLFVSRAESGFYDNTAFSVLAENLFAQVPPTDGSAEDLFKTDLAAVYGAFGFVLDGDKKASSSLVVVTAKTLSGLSRAYLEENADAFDEKRAEFYEKKGGVPDYEGRLALFGQTVDGFDVLAALAEGTTDGYTGGYNAEEPVTILGIRIEKAETE